MPDFISGPMLGPEQLAAIMPGTPAAGGKEVYYDSSAARAQFYEQMGGSAPAPGSIAVEAEMPGRQPFNEPAPAVTVSAANDPPVDDAIVRAAAEGRPLTPAQIASLPQSSPQAFTPPPTMMRAQPPVMPQPRLEQQPRPIDPRLEQPVGLVVRVGRGVTATVSFSGEPNKKHWARLLRFIEIAAEELDDEPTPEETARPAGFTGYTQEQFEAAVRAFNGGHTIDESGLTEIEREVAPPRELGAGRSNGAPKSGSTPKRHRKRRSESLPQQESSGASEVV